MANSSIKTLQHFGELVLSVCVYLCCGVVVATVITIFECTFVRALNLISLTDAIFNSYSTLVLVRALFRHVFLLALLRSCICFNLLIVLVYL